MPGCGMTVTEVLSKADESMYEQKKRPYREAERRLHEKQVGGDIPKSKLDTIRCACTTRW